MVQIGLYPHKCKQCGKKFEGRSEYAYKLSKYKKQQIFANSNKYEYFYFCSYRCLRAYERENRKETG